MTTRSTTLLRGFRGPLRARGLAAVEFVITVPLLILLLLAVAELGRAWVQWDALSYSVRNAARFVSEHALAGTSGVVVIDEETVAAPARKLVVYGSTAAGTPILPGFSADADHVTVTSAGDNNIVVTAHYDYQPMLGDAMPFLGNSSLFTLQVSVTMRAIS